jgi:hypothetical protein
MQNSAYIMLGGLSRPMAMGMKQVPQLQVIPTDDPAKAEMGIGTKPPRLMEELLASDSASMARLRGLHADLSFNMHASHDGEVKQTHHIGRIWSAHYPIKVSHNDACSVSTTRLALAPAFAGFAHGLVDQAALRSLAALSASLRTIGMDVVPDDTRTAINTLANQPIDAERLMCRMAVLWTASALGEKANNHLMVHNAVDDRAHTAIDSLAEYSAALRTAVKQGVQPIFVNVRGSVEGNRYLRIARILALDKPTFTLDDGAPAPSVTAIWPPIPSARAYALGDTRSNEQIGGVISSRDVAIFASYYARCLNVQDTLQGWLQFAAGHAYRPAGSALMGRGKRGIMATPPSQLAPTMLMPIVQAADTLDDEGILFNMDRPHLLLLQGAMQAGVLLAGVNNVLMAALGDAARRSTAGHKQRCMDHQRSITTRSVHSSGVVAIALGLAAGMGWENAFAPPWCSLSPASNVILGEYSPIEAEELLPWVSATPSTAGLLGLLRPAQLDDAPHFDAMCRTTRVLNRASAGDGVYGLIANGCEPTVHQMVTTAYSPAPEITPYTVEKNYRGNPTDGQFTAHQLDDRRVEPLFQLHTAAAILRAITTNSKRSRYEWHYEWHIAFSSTHAWTQYIDDGFSAAPPPVPVAAPAYPSEEGVPTEGRALPAQSRGASMSSAEMAGLVGADPIKAYEAAVAQLSIPHGEAGAIPDRNRGMVYDRISTALLQMDFINNASKIKTEGEYHAFINAAHGMCQKATNSPNQYDRMRSQNLIEALEAITATPRLIQDPAMFETEPPVPDPPLQPVVAVKPDFQEAAHQDAHGVLPASNSPALSASLPAGQTTTATPATKAPASDRAAAQHPPSAQPKTPVITAVRFTAPPPPEAQVAGLSSQ